MKIKMDMPTHEAAAIMKDHYGSRAQLYAERRAYRATMKGQDRRYRMWAAIAEELASANDGWQRESDAQWSFKNKAMIYQVATGYDWIIISGPHGYDVKTLAEAKKQVKKAL